MNRIATSLSKASTCIRTPICNSGPRSRGFFFQAEDGIRDLYVTGVQTCALPILERAVDLDRSQRARSERELVVVLQACGIEHAAPRVVAPTGNPDANGAERHRGQCVRARARSEERRVGKECRSRGEAEQ